MAQKWESITTQDTDDVYTNANRKSSRKMTNERRIRIDAMRLIHIILIFTL